MVDLTGLELQKAQLGADVPVKAVGLALVLGGELVTLSVALEDGEADPRDGVRKPQIL
jgi:hypothetical protein